MEQIILNFIAQNGFMLTIVVLALLLFGSSLIGPIDNSDKKKEK